MKKPKGHQEDPAALGALITANPLDKEGVDLKSNGDHVKAPHIVGRDYNFAGHEITLATPKEFKDYGIQFSKDPGRHVYQGSNIPNSRQGEAINNERLTTTRQGPRALRGEASLYSLNTRMPVSSVHIVIPNEYTQDFKF